MQTSVEPRQVRVGDRLHFKVTAFVQEEIELKPFPVDKTIGPFEVFNFIPGKPKPTKKGKQQDFHFILTTFEVGVSTIPALTFQYQKPDGSTGDIQTPDIPIQVTTVLTKESKDIRGIKAFVKITRQKLILWIIVSVIVLALLIIFLRKLLRKKQNQAPLEPPRPAHDIALEGLELLGTDLDESANVFYSGLSDILRTYFEGRFLISAMDKTSAEIFAALRQLPLSMEVRQWARDVLEISDLAKFAKFDPSREERLEHIARVREFVLRTKIDLDPQTNMNKINNPGSHG